MVPTGSSIPDLKENTRSANTTVFSAAFAVLMRVPGGVSSSEASSYKSPVILPLGGSAVILPKGGSGDDEEVAAGSTLVQ